MASANGQLRFTDSVDFSFTDQFYEQETARYLLESMPKDMFYEKVGAWIRKTTGSACDSDTFDGAK